jgi:hypothetical protein
MWLEPRFREFVSSELAPFVLLVLFNSELLLTEALRSAAVPLWLVAAVPYALELVSLVEVMLSVPFRAQPTNASKDAAISANFFIIFPISFSFNRSQRPGHYSAPELPVCIVPFSRTRGLAQSSGASLCGVVALPFPGFGREWASG